MVWVTFLLNKVTLRTRSFVEINIEGSGTEMQTDHLDEQNGSHCDNESCLMYYAMQRSDLIEQLFNDESIPALDANCIADLQANGGK